MATGKLRASHYLVRGKTNVIKPHNPDTMRTIPEPFASIYSHAVETQFNGYRQLFISGQIGVASFGETSITFRGQFAQALKNVETILSSADMDVQDIVKVTYYLTRKQDLDELVQMRTELWHGVRPAVTVVIVAGLADEAWFVEVDVTAQKQLPVI